MRGCFRDLHFFKTKLKICVGNNRQVDLKLKKKNKDLEKNTRSY